MAEQAFEDPERSAPLQTAMSRIRAMPAFMIVERYDEAVELLAHTFCWTLDELFYLPPVCKKEIADQKDKCMAMGIKDRNECEAALAEAVSGTEPKEVNKEKCTLRSVINSGQVTTGAVKWPANPEERAMLKRVLSLDLALYEYAVRIFDERIAQMRMDQANGLRCRYQWKQVEDGYFEYRDRPRTGREVRNYIPQEFPNRKCDVTCRACISNVTAALPSARASGPLPL